MIIDYLDARPIYEQIVEYYQKLILRGVMENDEQMPSVRQLSMELSTNPNTVQRAYQELEREGYLYSVKGKGSFVRPGDHRILAKREELLKKLWELLEEAEQMGIDSRELLKELAVRRERQ